MPINNIFDRTDKTLARKLAKNKFGEFERNRNTLLQAVGTDLAKLIGPALIEAAKTILGKQTIQVEAPKVTIPAPIVNVQAPKAPDVHVPAPIANVTVPPIKIPDINIPQMKWPDGEMPIYGKVTLDGVNEGNPLSVQIRDSKGRPVDFNLGSNIITSGGGGGIAKQVKINNTSDNPVPVTIASGGSATTASVPVDVDGIAYDGDNPAPVQISGVALAANQLPDGHNVTVDNASIAVTGTFYQATQPVSGTVTVADVTASVKTALIDSTGVQYSGSNPLPISDAGGALTVDGTVAVSGITNSVAAALVDSSGVQYSSSNPVPIDDAGGAITVDGTVTVSAITASTAVNIGDSTGVGYSGSNPLPITEVVTRGSYKTAYASVTNGTETNILTGEASYYHDLVWIMCANQSDVAVAIDLRETTGGTIMATIEVPANGTAGIAPTLPMPQSNISGAWTADMDDITGTTVDITALFKKET